MADNSSLLNSDEEKRSYLAIETHNVLCHNNILQLCLKFQNKPIKLAIEAIKKEYGDGICSAIIMDLMQHNDNVIFNPLPEITKSPKLFIPSLTKLVDSNITWGDRAIKHSFRNFRIRFIRILLLILVPVIFLVLVTYHCFNLGRVIAIALLCLFTAYFAIILLFVLSVGCCFNNKNDELHRIYSLSQRPNNWAHINTSFVNLLFKNHSIQSISELSAIYGGVTKIMLNTLGAYVWTAVVIFFAAELYYNRIGFNWDISDGLALIGTIGLLLISIFELDPFCVYMIIFHYIGAFLGSGCIVSYILQQHSYNDDNGMITPMCIAIIAVVTFICWQLIGVATDMAQKHEDRTMNFFCHCLERFVLCIKDEKQLKQISINTYSKLNIVCESIFLYMGALSLCLWLMAYEREGCTFEGLIGCSDPFPCNI